MYLLFHEDFKKFHIGNNIIDYLKLIGFPVLYNFMMNLYQNPRYSTLYTSTLVPIYSIISQWYFKLILLIKIGFGTPINLNFINDVWLTSNTTKTQILIGKKKKLPTEDSGNNC